MHVIDINVNNNAFHSEIIVEADLLLDFMQK